MTPGLVVNQATLLEYKAAITPFHADHTQKVSDNVQMSNPKRSKLGFNPFFCRLSNYNPLQKKAGEFLAG